MGRWVVAVLFVLSVSVSAVAAGFVEAPSVEVQSSGVAVVRWVASPPVTSYVAFGPADTYPQTGTRQVAGPPPVVASTRQAAEVTLDGLTAGTRYVCQVALVGGTEVTRSLLLDFTTPGTQSTAARGAPTATGSPGQASAAHVLNWSTRPPLPVPEEPVLCASLAFLAIFGIVILAALAKR